jgi:hypothetical protein
MSGENMIGKPDGGQSNGGEGYISTERTTEGDLIEAGFVNLAEKPPRWEERRHRAQTASYIAYILVGALVVTLVLHYIVVGLLGHFGDQGTVDALSQVFDKWLPVITGLVGGAVTYYFTKEGR